MKKKTLSLLCATALFWSCTTTNVTLDLAGQWGVVIDSLDNGVESGLQGQLFSTQIALPGTLDDAGLGIKSTLEAELAKPQLTHLTRKNSYVGAAWYSRQILVPASWEGKNFLMSLERVLWGTQVWIDGKRVEGAENSLTTPHNYDLTNYLTPGAEHILTVRVDNRKLYDVSNDLAHAYTDHTQIKWNGLLGEMKIEAVDPLYIEQVQLYPDVDAGEVKAIVFINNNSGQVQQVDLDMGVRNVDGGRMIAKANVETTAEKGISQVEVTCKMDNNFVAWSEFTPELYSAELTAKSGKMSSESESTFGMRKIESVGNKMFINGKPLFLRGTLECAIFPLTGTPPTDHAGWEKVFGAAKEYGLNHLRFHSWCPPKAAFEVADQMGFYLQVELPAWTLTIGEDQAAIDFLRSEGDNIIEAYGNHPSFCMWSLGNELQSDFTVLSAMVQELKAKDTRHLYTTTSFTFEKGHGVGPEPDDDFFITQWTKRGWVRGQGVFNQKSPRFDTDYVAQLKGSNIPLITHEIGQYSVYPDLTEIEKYTGVLEPLNFIAVKQDLEKKGRVDKAADYLKASGELAEILYKEEIERALKTDGISGFQLLDLHDFPGQGTALVGLLNAFWESKGITTGEEFREFCCEVVPLLRFGKATYTNAESFSAEIEVCNYSDSPMQNQKLEWKVLDGDKVIGEGEFDAEKLDFGYNGKLGTINAKLDSVREATQLDVVVSIEDTDYVNRWKIWVYPSQVALDWGEVKYTRSFDEAQALLAKGEKVLFNPDWKAIKGIEGKFVPVFWSPVHFPKQAGTMGLLCDPSHKALANFPTEMHTDWQWWDLNINSTTMIIDSLKGGESIVEMVDNFANNRLLTSLYEGSVGNGKLMMASFDLNSDMENRIVARQMLSSLLGYMNSADFNPSDIENLEVLSDSFVSTGSGEKEDASSIY
ncbi:MAG: glycoside hydrolase family 2 TIM barrel-domain containing protein [Rikenellaceae bacterium]